MAFLIDFKNYPITGIAILYEIHRPIARNTRPYDKEARRINAKLLSDHREFIKYFM